VILQPHDPVREILGTGIYAGASLEAGQVAP
jgi:hypothetical protein